MSKQNVSIKCKQRFKGVENFLRRVAFNLDSFGNVSILPKGLHSPTTQDDVSRQRIVCNTPSQTEVKIISCIPIDVTDLQQKILDLEKQLNEATACSTRAIVGNNTSCNAALCCTHYPRVSTTGVACNELDCDRSTSPCQRSNVTIKPSKIKSKVSFTPSGNCFCYSNTSNVHVKPSSSNPSQPLVICEPRKEERRNFFQKKKFPKKKRVKSQFVYYAQTSSTPFNDIDKGQVLDDMEAKMSDSITRSYLADVVSRQYRPKNLGRHISDVSEYSSPICRDSPAGCCRPCSYESDICSCCHGPFHNIDDQMCNQAFNTPTYHNEMSPRNAYYDSSFYDVVPVKDKPAKNKKRMDVPIMKEPKPAVDGVCCPREYQMIPRFRPFIVNYHSIKPARNTYIKNIPKNLKRRDSVLAQVNPKRKRAANFGQQIEITSSRSCCVEYGNVYTKIIRNEAKPLQTFRITRPLRKNAECLTTVINNSECQTITSNSEVRRSEGKTEATLNQIKTILQSVLTEVKTNSQLKNTLEYTPKKDAIVQKGMSQSNLQTSTFLNSFTYSPYNMNPYLAGSQQMNSNHYCNPQSTMKCLQNFPLIIQSGRYMCNSCYKNTSKIKSMCTKPATTTSTNTDEVKEERHKETEKLIKEIYKSIALNLPTKDTSLSDYEYLKSVHEFEKEIIKKPDTVKKNVVRAISEVFMKKNIQSDVSERNTSSKVTSATIGSNTQSESITADTERTQEKVARLLQNRNNNVSVSTAVESLTTPEEELDIISATESEASSSDVESDATYIPKEPPKVKQLQIKKEKKGLLSKMFKSVFKPKEKTKKAEKLEIDTESASDSDDYQTIYSQTVDRPQFRTRAVHLSKLKTHSKVSNSKQMYRERSPETLKKSPYMEQEYRRHWNERLMFDKQDMKYSSERPVSKDSTPRRVPYYQNYEARTAIVEPRQYYRGENQNPDYFQRGYAQKATANLNYKYGTTGAKGMAWLKKHKMGIHCGEQWKKLILEG